MKNIELTKDHKSKLLEMCEKLFPEYDFTLDKWEQCFVTLGLKSKVAYDSHIHWFEFCMTHLARVLMCKNTKHMQQLFMGLKHPVDYLYEEFKKLK